MQNLENKVAVITGGASGIGRALADRFAAAGMKIVLADIEEGPLDNAAKEIRETGAEVLTRISNVSDAEAVDDLAKATLDTFGAAHIVCNNAGVGGGTGPIWELSLKDWEFTFGANIWGIIHGVRSFAPTLLAQNEGHFVNTASMAGLVSMANMGPYNVTKHGVVSYSETMFEDLRNAGSDVGVSVLCPAFVNTKIWDSDRNRPEEFKNPENETKDAKFQAGKQMLKAVIENAMPAKNVANAVHDAILEKQLYILTHGDTQDYVERRMNNIISGKNPEPTTSSLQSLTGKD
jgi:NAD(P)-dependent dehydrogenase (short-subunit alcohol dehydrogenase family)|tara:strand:+ start:322 stop:1194 length:873 start_codon:yes stop_codon:yes gene_type:complete